MSKQSFKPDDAHEWPAIKEIVSQVLSGKKTAKSQVEESLRLIKNLNNKYDAVISIIEEASLLRAEYIDNEILSGRNPGRLSGVPFIAKDNYLVFGAETTAGSNMLKGFNAPYQATAIEKLEAEGAICVAKANLDAFAHGGSTENSDFAITKNPWDLNKVSGGSSGGSAAAVSLGLAPFSLGTDTGGSIRQPASYCGVIGYKPTYGLISRSGVVAMASSTDVLGPFSKSIEDAAIVIDVMAGRDPLDSTTIERNEKSYTEFEESVKGKKIGVIKEYFDKGLDEQVAESVKQSIEKFKEAGAEIVDISLPSVSLALAVYYIIVPAELSSNLARHDGQRYMYSAEEFSNLEESYEKSRSNGFGAEAKRRIMIGAHVLSSGYYDAYYKKAQTVRTKIINEFKAAFKDVDFLVGPVAPTTAFKIGANDDPVKMYLQDIMTVAANLTGSPAVSLPIGFDNDKMPIGLQVIADQNKDRELLSIAKVYEELA